MSSASDEHRCGIIALLGRPNCGKSTLLNALIGEKLAITSHRAQTTRGRVLGVLTEPGAQLVFYDTPGVHRGQARFNLAMTDTALKTAADADLRVLLFEAGAEWDTPEERVAELGEPLLLVRTKCDLGPPSGLPRPERFAQVIDISAVTGRGLEELKLAFISRLPVASPLYPEDYLTDSPMRFLAAEWIREVGFEMLRDEIPYSLAIEILAWDESEDELRVRANLLMERDSQKGIVVGAGGQMLKQLGSEARRRLVGLVGKPVHLNLWVKTDKNWSKKLRRVRQLGYL
jgi:GTP-binding protein Era